MGATFASVLEYWFLPVGLVMALGSGKYLGGVEIPLDGLLERGLAGGRIGGAGAAFASGSLREYWFLPVGLFGFIILLTVRGCRVCRIEGVILSSLMVLFPLKMNGPAPVLLLAILVGGGPIVGELVTGE